MLNPVNNKNMSGSELADMANTLMGKFSFQYILTPSQRYEDVLELLKKSANAYKIESNWKAAGHGYLRIVKFINDNQSKGFDYLFTLHDLVENYLNAAHCFDKISHLDKNHCISKAIEIYKGEGNFKRAGKLQMDIAYGFEKSLEFEKAIESYKKAYELFHFGRDKISESVDCLNKIAELSIGLNNPDWEGIVQIYDKIIEHYQSVKLGYFQLKKYISMVLLVILCYESETNMQQKYLEYSNKDYTFETSNEGKFIAELVKSLENSDVILFKTSCYMFDKIKTIDNLMVTLLTKIKDRIQPVDNNDIALDGPEEVDLT